MTRPKWGKEKERVYRAAMRWYLWYQSKYSEAKHATKLFNEFDAACAAASKRRRK